MKKSFMERLAAFIVDKRRLFVVLFAVACVLSIFSASKTDVNNELTDYLPDSTQTRQGLEIMNSEFITYGDAKVMVSNVTLAQAEELAEMLRGVDGVKDVVFEKDTHHYNSASALFEVTFDGEKLDEISIQGVKNVRAALDGYDTYITTEVGNPTGEILEREMRIVLIILMCSIFVVLLLTSHTYAEVPVLIITFGVAVWVNKGTNYWFHEVSFITNSIAAVLRGAGKAIVPMFTMMVCWCVIRVTFLTVTVPLTHSIQMVYWVYPLTWALSSLTFFWYYHHGNWLNFEIANRLLPGRADGKD